MSGISVLALFGVCFIFHSASSSPTLNCAGLVVNDKGEKEGKFIGIISKEGWKSRTNYLFQPNGEPAGCVQFDELPNPTRAKLIFAAYLTNANVKITTNADHFITGIAFENPAPAAN